MSPDGHFADRLESFGSAVALIDEAGIPLTYSELAARADEFGSRLTEPGFLLVEARNHVEAIVAYLGALRAHRAVMLLPADKPGTVEALSSSFRPGYLFRQNAAGEWVLSREEYEDGPAELHPDLALLLSTSGSTGSGKLVRLSRSNLDANARSIAEYLELSPTERGVTALPIFYSYGQSIISSHLAVGASVLVTEHSIVEDSFWDLFRATEATSLAVVPYGVELLERTGALASPPPSLRYVTQAGGRLPPEAVLRMCKLANAGGFRFFVMYGATEATARMSYLPPNLAEEHPDSIGIAIPGGRFWLQGQNGEPINEEDQEGELVYEGDNVMMGYATEAAHLALPPELHELHTGDIARRDSRGLYRIVGRSSRFLKLFGLRINLDDVERLLREVDISGVCTGDDDRLVVAVRQAADQALARARIVDRCGLPAHSMNVIVLEELPLLPTGKIDYQAIRRLGNERTASVAPSETPSDGSVREIFERALGVTDVNDDDTFASLGGDSLAFVETAVHLERHLGALPRGWEQKSVGDLERGPRKATGRWSTLEIPVVLRALAIVAIVVNHSVVQYRVLPFPIEGAANLLMLVSGFSLARFQLSQVVPERQAFGVLRWLPRIIVPTILINGLVDGYRGQLSLPLLTLTSNILEPGVTNKMWFIETLVQLHLIVFLLLTLPAARRLLRESPFRTALAWLGLALGFQWLGDTQWGTHFAYQREPYNLMWMFVLGMAMNWARSRLERGLCAALVLALSYVYLGWGSSFVWLAFGGLLMLTDLRLTMPRWAAAGVAGIASASLYMYITHFVVLSVLHDASHWIIRLVPALLVGIVAHRLVEWALVMWADVRSARPSLSLR